MPHSDDGMRIEPPPSDPVHSGTSPAAMAAAEPPDEPPALRVEVPRVAGGAEERVDGVGLVAALGGVGLADDDAAGRLQPLDERRVVVAIGLSA